VLLLFRCQLSTAVLISYTFGVFLPFIREDLRLSPLQAGLLQGVWWVTPAALSIPVGAWFSRFRPVRLVMVALLLQIPFLLLQALAENFVTLLIARFLFVLVHVLTNPARTLLLQQWALPRQFALINAVGLSQHSLVLALAISTSALLITGFGSWRAVYYILAAFLALQAVAWWFTARERNAPALSFHRELADQPGTPLRAILVYPQVWFLAVTMFSLAATWTSLVTFLPTLWLEERDIPLTLGGPLLAFLYYGLIPGSLIGGVISDRVRNPKVLLAVPAALNLLLGLAITVSDSTPVLMVLITALGMVWIATPAMQVLPFRFQSIRPREVAVVTSLVITFSGIGFATGPVITGLVAQLTGSLQTGLVVLCLITGVGVVAGVLYPSHEPSQSPG
jgi:predicted MFS family arabinose efflux permease